MLEIKRVYFLLHLEVNGFANVNYNFYRVNIGNHLKRFNIPEIN